MAGDTCRRITSDQLNNECLRRRYVGMLSRPEVFPTAANWDFIITNRLRGLTAGLYRKYLVSWLLDPSDRCDYHRLAIERMPDYVNAVDREEALDVIYGDVDSSPDAFVALVRRCHLFDADRLNELLDEGYSTLVVDLLDAGRPDYGLDDLAAMRRLSLRLSELPQLGSIENHKGLLSGGMRYICPNGHVNQADVVFCAREDCGLDICGLTAAQRDAVDRFAERIDVLADMLDSGHSDY